MANLIPHWSALDDRVLLHELDYRIKNELASIINVAVA